MPVNYQNPFGSVYPNQQQLQQPIYRPTAPQGNLIWVSGIEGAKAWNVAPGQSVPLFDSEDHCFYVKSADTNGFPQPIRIFDYTERVMSQGEPIVQEQLSQIDTSGFATKEDFSDLHEAIKQASEAINDMAVEINYLKDKLDRKPKPYQEKKGGKESHA